VTHAPIKQALPGPSSAGFVGSFSMIVTGIDGYPGEMVVFFMKVFEYITCTR